MSPWHKTLFTVIIDTSFFSLHRKFEPFAVDDWAIYSVYLILTPARLDKWKDDFPDLFHSLISS